MRIGFGINKNADSSWSVGAAPVFDFEDWSLSFHQDRIVARPSPKNLLVRLGVIAAAAAIMIPIVISIGPPWAMQLRREIAIEPIGDEQRQELDEIARQFDDDFRERFGEERWQELQKELEQKRKERQDERIKTESMIGVVDMLINAGYWLAFLLVVLVGLRYGLYNVLLYPFDKCNVINQGNDLVVIRKKLFGHATQSFAWNQFHQIVPRTKEERTVQPPIHHGWVWSVELHSSFPGQTPVKFFLYRQKTEPRMDRVPPVVKQWIEWLERSRQSVV